MIRAPESDPSSAPHLAGTGPVIVSPTQAGKPPSYWSLQDILLVGLAAVLFSAVVLFETNRRLHQNARENFAAQLLTAKAAFLSFTRERGTLPEGAASGIVPPGMAPYLGNLSWSGPTAAGGNFRWNYRPAAVRGGTTPSFGMIEITAFPPSPRIDLSFADLLELDRQIDDGNLETGDFRLGFNGWPTLRIASRR